MALTEREYQPSLLWIKTLTFAQVALICAHITGVARIGAALHRMELRIYPTNMPGAWILNGPKLHWQRDLSEPYVTNCSQNDLWLHHATLGEVTLFKLREPRDVIVIGETYEAAWNRLRGNAAAQDATTQSDGKEQENGVGNEPR